ncbi:LPS export ABC transporter periplasmic protein LptC [Wenyingzhuangia sp. 2_MG-2023]|uniref:LPS export ABC transporter periplasmic protein LptC n=1 Tax=Wenyingzhuangia sp. 2_MG-2023 TaxID=3062639 RepID=UPI0026E27BF0|nr:LPS export ABC transporter periplasmic protein LptC [Wenyingzhuangia sp. 2_MG-2023]MDO6737217.1 LPS export ABC transporter periplasmic protein LptC [Wenyingzhuangia sp. 2_MG-2023]MDO6801705.1 LPS export ABC transporter periplasmic protein LptC [Wenyingzhuangia sp. 1_MG-2023]
MTLPVTSILKQLGKVALLLFLLASCKNSSKEINDFLADQNLPIGVAEDINMVHKDSGKVTSRMISPLLWDFTNRKLNPYFEFPKGVKIVTIDRITRDSVTITGDYAISYQNTAISEIIGNVVVVNHRNGVVLNSEQMFRDQRENYFFTETPFTLYTEKDTLHGVGFESNGDLSNWILNNTNGNIAIEDKEDK